MSRRLLRSVPRSPFSTPLSGSAREVEERIRNIFQYKKKRPPLFFLLLSCVLALTCGGLVSCEGQETPTPLSAPGEDGTPEPFYSENPSDGSTAYFYQGMDLDGAGGLDDSLTVTSYGADVGGETRVAVTLGTGEVLTWTEPGYYFPVALPGYLCRPDRQSLVLELDAPYSNYGDALYVVLEVEGDALVERARLELDGDGLSLLHSAYLQEGGDGLQALRLPALLDKWHSPVWSTLSWDGSQFSIVSDGYFTDREGLSLPDGGELTLELTGTWSLNDRDLPELYYSQVQVFQGDALLQTILPQFPLPAPQVFDADTAEQVTPPASCYPAHGFSAESTLHALDLRDVNFDGFPDLGLPCDTTHNDIHAWYLWDPSSQQFQYAFALQGALTVEQDGQLLLEKRWEEETHLYSFNARGQLVWQGPA